MDPAGSLLDSSLLCIIIYSVRTLCITPLIRLLCLRHSSVVVVGIYARPSSTTKEWWGFPDAHTFPPPHEVWLKSLSCFERASVGCPPHILNFCTTSFRHPYIYLYSSCLREGVAVVPIWSRGGSSTGSSGKDPAIIILIKARHMNRASTVPS